MNAPRRRMLLGLLILVSCIGCDQATKGLATRTLLNSPPRSYFGDTLRLEYALNSGGFLSLGGNLSEGQRGWIFIGFNSSVMLGLAGYLCLKRNQPLVVFVSLTLILAGGIGNLIDRVGNHGLVTDFINIGIGSLRTGIFNVADMAVMLGAVLIGYVSLSSHDAGPGEQ